MRHTTVQTVSLTNILAKLQSLIFKCVFKMQENKRLRQFERPAYCGNNRNMKNNIV